MKNLQERWNEYAEEIVNLLSQIKAQLEWTVYYMNVRTQYGERRAEQHKKNIDELIEKLREECGVLTTERYYSELSDRELCSKCSKSEMFCEKCSHITHSETGLCAHCEVEAEASVPSMWTSQDGQHSIILWAVTNFYVSGSKLVVALTSGNFAYIHLSVDQLSFVKAIKAYHDNQ